MTYEELVLPPTSVRKQPLSYEAYAKDALEKAKEAHANWLVARLVELYNKTDREQSFEIWLRYTAKNLAVLAKGDIHEEHRLKNPAIDGMGINDALVGYYIQRRLADLARIWELPELAQLKVEEDGFGRPLRIKGPYSF